MEKDPHEKGYEDGHEGKEYDNRDEIINPMARLGYIAFDVVTGNKFGKMEEADNKAESYDDGYNEGITDREHNE